MAISMKFHLEIPFLLIFFCFMLSEFITTNLILYRTCYVTLGFNISDCALLGSRNASDKIKAIETKVQPTATIIMMVQTIINAIIPVFCSLFVGPWSNKHGRKPILLSSFIGYFVAYLVVIVFCLLPWISPWWWLVSSIISSLGGGVCSMLTVCFCYIVDTTSEGNRGIRMGVIEAIFSIGALAGTLSTSYIFNHVGYLGIYIICTCITFLAVLYIYFFVPESVNNVQQQGALRDLFDTSVVVNTFKTCFKSRQNKDRTLLGLLIGMLTIYIFVVFSDSAVFYLFIREKFHWPLSQYTQFSGANSLIEIFGSMFILVVLYKFLKINDMYIILFGFAALSTSSILYGLASQDWHIYLASAIKRLSCANGPLGRSAISMLLPPDDLGHVFAFTTSLETIMQLVSSPVYTLLYNSTLNSLPSAFNFLSASMYGLNIFVTSAVILIRRLYPSSNIRVINNE